MINPFDRSFFKFLLGFAIILCLSFAVLYAAGRFGNLDEKDSSATTAETR